MLLTFSNTCLEEGISAWEDATPLGNKLYHDGGDDKLVELTMNGSNPLLVVLLLIIYNLPQSF